MHDPLVGMRIVEMASFVAAPSCGLHLLQLGAEVVRIDPLQGGPDAHRWPLSASNRSLYWEGLNKGKKSVRIDLSNPEGRELAVALITRPDPGGGMFLTNLAPDGFFSHERLAARRSDLLTIRVMGWSDGATAVDYTVNAALGVPYMTGPIESGSSPVNHVLPAWDLLTGSYAAFSLLAAERHRRLSGIGQEIRVPLGDVAAATLANLGQVAEVTAGPDRTRMGNDLFGALGRDFVTADGHSAIVVAITPRQWSSLVAALDLSDAIRREEVALGVSFETDEGVRFQHRDRLFPMIETAIAAKALAELAAEFDRLGVSWSPYRTLKQALSEERVFSAAYGLFDTVEHPSGLRYATPRAPANFTRQARGAPPRAPRLGEHTHDVLTRLLGLSDVEVRRLQNAGIVAGPDS